MQGFLFYFLLCLFTFIPRGTGAAPLRNIAQGNIYIVYMGAADSRNATLRNDHSQILSSVIRRNAKAVVHTYRNGFSGFAARLSKEEANSIAQKPGVVSVFPDPLIQLHTTHSWDFLKYQTGLKIDSSPSAKSNPSSFDTIVGILDTGIWPESASFTDNDMGPIPSRWKGTCMEAKDFNSSNCNRKLIGARFYGNADSQDDELHTPRDSIGHGTHVASTAAGSTVVDASFYGLAEGTATGGSPGSRIAVYRVCSENGCRGSAILKAFEDAITDGVDVLSLSLGAPAYVRPELTTDPIAIGSFHAVEHGITVVCSAGNDGPASKTVSNVAPWILTVAASTIDRDWETDVVLGDGKVIKGEGISFSTLDKSPTYPLIYAESAKKDKADVSEARQCHSDALESDKVKGRVVICDGNENDYATREMIDVVKAAGGAGLVAINDETRAVASAYLDLPTTVISSNEATDIFQYLNSTSKPVATILPTITVTNYKPAPRIAYFSSRGPSFLSRNILKPDIAAPGVAILAAWIANDTAETPQGKDPPQYNVVSGTSMSCPHVSGVVANIKSQNPTWSPSAIRSAIMTTAIKKNNLKGPITTDSSIATPYDYGAGEVTTSGSLLPGLVYETTTADYLNFLCFIGYNATTIKTIAHTAPNNFACPTDSSSDNISNINYPSIALSNFNGTQGKNVSRTLTNVGEDDETVYTATVDAPSAVNVKVIPEKLQFTGSNKKLSFQVVFSPAGTLLKEDVFGSITWTDGKYVVSSPFVLSSKPNID